MEVIYLNVGWFDVGVFYGLSLLYSSLHFFLFSSGKTLYFNIILCISSMCLCISSNIHILLCFILFLYVSLAKEILTIKNRNHDKNYFIIYRNYKFTY